MRMKGAVAVVLRNCVHVRRVPCLDCVALHALLWCDAPAIVHAVYRGVSVVAYRHRRGTYIRQTLFLTSTMVDEEKVGVCGARDADRALVLVRRCHGLIEP